MKLAMLTMIVLLLASPALSQYGGSIGLFADEYGMQCNLMDPFFQPVSIYIIHMYTPGATGSQFRVEQTPGMNMMYLSFVVPAYIIYFGDPFTGMQVAYGGCYPAPILIMRLDYLGQGMSSPCSYVRIVDHVTTAPSGIFSVDCNSNLLPVSGGELVVNPTYECDCNVPNENSSWGQIKSLYQ